MKFYTDEVSDERIEAALDTITECGFCIDDGSPTMETLEDWKQSCKKWNYLESKREKMAGEFAALIFEGAQAMKGQRRQTVVVLDLGAFRAVFKA